MALEQQYLSSSTDLSDQKVNADIRDPSQKLVADLGVLEDPFLGLGQRLAAASLNHVCLISKKGENTNAVSGNSLLHSPTLRSR